MAKNKGGRPLKFQSVKELESKLCIYFKDNNGETIEKLPTVCGLAVALDTSRETLCNYEKKEEFFDTIKKAKSKCEAALEKWALRGKLNPAVSIFSLKNNHRWVDKSEVDNTHGNKPGEAFTIDDISNMTAEEKTNHLKSLIQS